MPIYNVAGGADVTHGALLERLSQLTGCTVEVAPDAPLVRFPPLSIARAAREFDFRPRPLLDDIAALVGAYPGKRHAP
jgi:nucleoside-diphosphate-sugar epimerase